MYSSHQIHALPDNFREFADEMADGISGVYGEATATAYRGAAHALTASLLRRENACAVAVRHGITTAGLLVAQLNGTSANIVLLHVLRRYEGQGGDCEMIRHAVSLLRQSGARRITLDTMLFCRLQAEELLARLGFEVIERALMSVEVGALSQGVRERHSLPVQPEEYGVVAGLIAQTYVDHPDRRLHFDEGLEEGTRGLVQRVAGGGYGRFRRTYMRAWRVGDELAGVILGCEVAVGYGFIVQVAVPPSFQGIGIGSELIKELALEFEREGLTHLALGVTVSNRALGLYQRLGFSVVRGVSSWVWAG